MDFETALRHVLHHEGGFVSHKDDPGGATNYGITVAVARDHGYAGHMRDIPMDLVRTIYRRSYWDRCRCDELPAIMRLDVFDGAVNSGVSRSIRWLQESVGATTDGLIGPQTIRAAWATGDARLAYNAARLQFLSGLSHWPAFGRGWVRRVAYNMGVQQ